MSLVFTVQLGTTKGSDIYWFKKVTFVNSFDLNHKS